MATIPARLRRLVIKRAQGRCEYCRLEQAGQEATFHIDHIRPMVEGGETKQDNLALACVSCSLRKAARSHGLDPLVQQQASLFDPRQEEWGAHFRWESLQLIGLTPTGRATVQTLQLNRPLILAIRAEEVSRGRL